ncbi:MAG TPA: nucleoside-diphosphate sugar epimerase/dehydratase, partial [Thermoanaerobaculia bacterium]|nr:nucleoside-diphosphate sugar epimerase/dehydratase [Thermoanaerobaculia bacterium]
PVSMAENNWVERYIFRVAAVRVALLFLFHALVFTLCYLLAWLVRFEFSLPAVLREAFETSLPLAVGVQLLVGLLFGFYRGWWRYVGIGDVIRLAAGLTTALAALMALWYASRSAPQTSLFFGVSRAALLIDWAFVLLCLSGARVALRVTRDRTRERSLPAGGRKRVLIIGAGDAGETLARELEHRPQLGLKAVAFVDDHPGKWRSHIRGIVVRGPISEIGSIAAQTGASEALIAMPSAPGKRIRQIVHDLSAAELTFRTLPGIDQLVSGEVHVAELRPLNVDDLLRRDRIELPGHPVQELVRGRRILVTGAGGTIGSELASQILDLAPADVSLVERSEFALYQARKKLEPLAQQRTIPIAFHLLDIASRETVEPLLERSRPHIVLHAAAHKHVPMGEENPAEYLRNNALAARDFAEICSRHHVERFVFISTDKAINPTSIMGASKRAGEILLLDLVARSNMTMTVVRFGNVIGSSGSVVPLFLEQIEKGGPVTVTHPDVTRYFLRTSEAVSLVLQAVSLGNGGRVFMLDMGEPVRIVDLARDLIHLANKSENEIPIVFTGLRPGEKLFEEIRLQGEKIYPTLHPRIVVTEAEQPDAESIVAWRQRAGDLVDGDPESVRRLLVELVPEYRPDQGRSPETDPPEGESEDSFGFHSLLQERLSG